MNLKEPSSVATSGQPALSSKFKPRTKDFDSPKSVISDPRIVSPASSASASLERRLTDLKRQPRHDRIHSISDTDDEKAMPGVYVRGLALSHHQSTKGNSGQLESAMETHWLPSVPGRRAQTSGQSSETSSPRNRMSRNLKDGAKSFVRGSDGELANRRIMSAGGDATTSTIFSPFPHLTERAGLETESLTCSPPKSRNHVSGVSDNAWRNVTGFRDPRPYLLQTLAREPVQEIRLAREESIPAVNLQSDGKDAPLGSMYNILMNGFNGPTLEQIITGRGTVKSGDPISRDSKTVKNGPGLPYEDQIELNKFVVRGSGGEEIKAGEHKIAVSHGTTRELPNCCYSFSGDGRSNTSGYRNSRSSKTSFSPGDSPGHPTGFSDWPRSASIELSSDFVLKATSQVIKGFPEMQIVQPDKHTCSMKFMSESDYLDKASSNRLVDGWKKSYESHEGGAVSMSTLPEDRDSSLHSLVPPQSHPGVAAANVTESPNVEKNIQQGGKVPGMGETSRAGLMPQQRFVSGQFLKSNPLKPRPPPAKWDEAEKWLVGPASMKGIAPSQCSTTGQHSGSSTPQHISQCNGAVAGRQHHLANSNQSSRLCGASGDNSLPNGDVFDARFVNNKGNVSGHTYTPTSGFDSLHCNSRSTTDCVPPEESLVRDTKQAEVLNNEAATGLEGKDHPLPDGGTLVNTKTHLLLTVNNTVRQKSERQQAENLLGSRQLQEPMKVSSVGLADNIIEGAPCNQNQDPFAASIFDQFTKDKFADSITVQSTTSNNGRLIIVMKDAATEITPSTSQRDIATQITPVPSFHAALTPPHIHAVGPARLNTTPVHSERRPASVGVDVTELQNCHQAKLYLDQAAALDTNWTTREEEVEESSKSLRLSVSRSVDFKEVKRNVLEARAAAWEEAEQSKYMSRYHREEAKILAWEAHQKAKAEADMRKMEVKMERMRSHANEILQNKLASVHLKAENMRAAAAAECGEQAAKTNQWAQKIRTNGRSPSASVLCCLPRLSSNSL